MWQPSSYVLVLPDHGNSEAIPVESDYSSPGCVRFHHVSGRPWVAGRLLGCRLVCARDRNAQIVVIASREESIIAFGPVFQTYRRSPIGRICSRASAALG